jgi:hypothetical protein
MSRILASNRKTFVFAACLVLLLSAVALAIGVQTKNQQRHNQKVKQDLLEKIEKSPEQPLRIAENADSPLRIVYATVKEAEGSEYTKLTGQTTDLTTVPTVPEARLFNSSGKTITSFAIAVRNPNSRSIRGFIQRAVSIAPGETYTVERQHFLNPDKITVPEGERGYRQKLVLPKLDSEKSWLSFGRRSDLFITVGRVQFDDASTWTLKEGGEIR